jgi:integrase
VTTSRDVRVWNIQVKVSPTTKKKSYNVRWTVSGREMSKAFSSRALADNFRTDLKKAIHAGEAFDLATGLPESLAPKAIGETWLAFVKRYVKMKWPDAASKSRVGMSESLVAVTAALVADLPGKPEDAVLRLALRDQLDPGCQTRPEADAADALRWLEDASLPLASLADTQVVRIGVEALSLKLDGTAAAASTRRRKRAVFYNVLEYAIELELLEHNPIDRLRVKSRRKQVVEAVDRRVVANPRQIRACLVALENVGQRKEKRGVRLKAYFGCLYYAALRPGEALGLRAVDCELPETGWGRLTVQESRPEAGKRWTDSGEAHDRRGLKHRPEADTRPVPIPPELVGLLRWHLDTFGTAPDGRLFRSRTNGVVGSSSYTKIWREARLAALSPAEAASILARRPYDLRHGGVSLWLNAGVPAPEVAARAGHSVDVLLKVYAKCIDGEEHVVNARIDQALR